ncbi:MAG: FAD-binding oxidoreductase, partial [Akkermansiaceae bacterium]
CKTEQDVVRAIHYANVAKLQVTVKSGGHSFEGFSSNNGGLMVDLTELNGIDYSKQDHSVKIGPGARLGNVSSALFPKGRLLPSGSCAGVGVGGLTLGGGYGLFAREFGLTCDHLTGLRMVDGQGRVIDSDDDPELLHACRGGGNGNFGVVTQMRFRTVPVPKLFSSQRIKFRKLDPKTVGELAKLWFAATAKIPNDVFSAFVLNGTSLTILITFFRKQSTADVEAAFASLRKRAWKNEAIQSAPTQRAILRYYGRPGPLPFKNASAGYYNSHEQIEKILPAIAAQVAKVSGTVWQVNTLGGAINSPEYAKASLYPHRASPWLGEIQGYWDNPKREERCVANVAAVQKLFADHGIKDHYRNYPDIG